MAKGQWAKRFLREHLATLDAPTATTPLVKRLRQRYFDSHGLASASRFTNKEVANELGLLLARKGFESIDALERAISDIPFMKEELHRHDIEFLYTTSAKSAPTHLSTEDLSQMREEHHLKRIENQIAARVEGAALERVREQQQELEGKRLAIEQETKKLHELRSELEDWPSTVAIADLISGLETDTPIPAEPIREQPWWKEARLASDPFPSNQGLAEIPREKYDAVVVQTSFFKYYLEAARKAPSKLLGKTSLILGEFGSGKTTLFQYVTATLGAMGVLPVMVILNPHPNVANLTTKMLEQMRLALSPIAADRLGRDPRREGHAADPEGDVIAILQDLQTHGTGGFVVFVDGLHKGTTYTEQVLEFLQQIQNVQELFTQQGVKLGFVVAGSPHWEQQLALRPSLSGSFYRKDTVPPLSEDLAFEAVERRLKAFAQDPDHPITVRRDSLRKAFQILKDRLGRNITFRDFLDHVRLRFEAREFDELGLVVRLHFESVELVHEALRSLDFSARHSALFKACDAQPMLIEACKNVCLEVLAKTSVAERSPFFTANRPAFHLLFKNGFIAKRKGAEGNLVWTLSGETMQALVALSKSTSIAPDDVMLALFQSTAGLRSAEERTVLAPVIELLTKLCLTWEDSWRELVKHMEHARFQLGQMDDRAATPSSVKHMRSTLVAPIVDLVDALNWFVHGEAVDPQQRWTKFEMLWCAPENASEIARFAGENSVINGQTAYFGVLHEVSRLVSGLLELLESLVRGEGLVRLRGRQLTREEFAVIHELRGLHQQQAYREVIDRATDMLEDRIRNTIYPIMRAAWGSRAVERLPADLQAKIRTVGERGHPRARRVADDNFLYDLSRSEYSKILFEAAIYQCTFKNVVENSDKARMKDLFELAFSLNDRLSHRDRASFFREKATEIADVLRALPRMLEVFHQLSNYILVTAEFNFETPHDGTVIARFMPTAPLAPHSAPIRVAKKDAASITKEMLTSFSVRPIEVSTLDDLLVAGTMAPEIQLAMVRVNIRLGYIQLEQQPFAPAVALLTSNGRQELARFTSSTGQTSLAV